MVDHGDVDRFSGQCKGARGPAIGNAGIGVTAGMIVSKQQPGTSKTHRIGDNGAHRQVDRRISTTGISLELETPRGIVNVRNPQRFMAVAVRRREAGLKKVSRRLVAGKQGR